MSILLDEDAGTAQAPEWRLVRRKLLAVDDVSLLNLHGAAHVQTGVKQPITGLRAATQQPDKAGDTGWGLARAAFQTSQDWLFLRFSWSIALLIVGHVKPPAGPSSAGFEERP